MIRNVRIAAPGDPPSVSAGPVEGIYREFELLWFMVSRAGTTVTREMYYGEWEGKTQEEIVERDRETWDRLARPSADFRPPGGESLAVGVDVHFDLVAAAEFGL